MFYTKKPIKVEAVETSAAIEAIATRNFEGVPAFVADGHRKGLFRLDGDEAISINSENGIIRANPDDMLVQGVKGEIYPVEANAFAYSYDAVPEEEPVDEEKKKQVSDGA